MSKARRKAELTAMRVNEMTSTATTMTRTKNAGIVAELMSEENALPMIKNAGRAKK